MLSKQEKKYLEMPGLFNKNYRYKMKHQITKKILELEKDLDSVLKSKTVHKDLLKGIFENYLVRVEWDVYK